MDELIQANLELHDELGKEVRINLENELKIKRLERQQARYEDDIQYLYGIIEKLESQKVCDNKELHSLRIQLAESHLRLKESERVSDEKEKFICFCESQLLESEDIIFKLKQQIQKMASGTGSLSTKSDIEIICDDIHENLAVLRSVSPSSDNIQRAINNVATRQGQISVFGNQFEEMKKDCARMDTEHARVEVLCQ